MWFTIRYNLYVMAFELGRQDKTSKIETLSWQFYMNLWMLKHFFGVGQAEKYLYFSI